MPAIDINPATAEGNEPARMSASSGPGGLLTLTLSGRLDAAGTARLWGPAHDAVRAHGRAPIVLDATGVTYCDGAGVALLAGLARVSRGAGGTVTIEGLRPEFRRLLELLDPGETRPPAVPAPAFISLPVQVGEVAAGLWRDLHALVTFVGELALALGYACRHARKVRWRDALFIAENVGANALPIVALISLLTGLIMAFQAVIPMRQFGAEIYVADLVALVVLREMGPLMTAIILAGRSGSAFAAEIGTMKVNEEINALITMGLEPVRFLVVPRVLAAVMMTPLLTLFANFFGLAGGAIVFVMQGFPLITYHQEVVAIADMGDFLGGLAKSFVFGILVAGIGCLRGLQTQAGASAVGLSTTRAVVSGIILIVLADAVFSVVYYALGI